jgi:hypothetical protein
LKEEALDRTMGRNRFGGGFGPAVRQNTSIEWMNVLFYLYFCLFGFKMLPVSFGYFRYSSSPSQFHSLTPSCLPVLTKTLSAGCVSVANHFVQRRRYLQQTECFFKTDSALLCDVFISTYLCFSAV